MFPSPIGETLVKGCIQDLCLEVLDEAAAAKAAKVSLSIDTIARRTADLADNMEIQLVDQIKLAKYYFLQLDESADIGNMAILMVYVRYEYEGKLNEEFFSLLLFHVEQLVQKYQRLLLITLKTKD